MRGMRSGKYSLSSSISTRFSSSEVLFWRRSSFCLGWQRGKLGAQSPWAFNLQMRHRSPWRVWPAARTKKERWRWRWRRVSLKSVLHDLWTHLAVSASRRRRPLSSCTCIPAGGGCHPDWDAATPRGHSRHHYACVVVRGQRSKRVSNWHSLLSRSKLVALVK